jgi:outer membrane scaffolding protein for murein synthesis (MipA/OmpV family)
MTCASMAASATVRMVVMVATAPVWRLVGEFTEQHPGQPHRRYAPTGLVSIFFLLATLTATAGPLLDRIRDYDLNDYSLGLAYTTAQSPYVGASNSMLVYPFLSSFEHSAFTRDWLLIRGENMGLRYVTDSDWEFGVIGRVQTLGLGTDSNDALLGIDDKSWTIEAGPMIGWRGWPIHLQFRSYWELPNRHDGMTSEVEVSLPRQREHSYFIPAVKISYLSSGYNNYYFGVAEQEATAPRPEYAPGAATNIWAGFTFGYELTPRWQLKGVIGFEQLDNSIQASPLVAHDKLWSGSIGVAYNANLFVSRDAIGGLKEREFEVRLGTLSGAIDTEVSRDSGDGQPGDTVDLENFLGAADRETIFQVDGRVRIGRYHRIELGAFRLARRSTTTIEDDLAFGDRTYLAGAEIESKVESEFFRVAYAYSLMRDGQKELGVMAGLGYFRFETTLREAGLQQPERFRAKAPLPTFGVFAAFLFNGKWQLNADANVFALDFDSYNGVMSFLRLGLERKFGSGLGAGVGYDYYALRLRARERDFSGDLGLRYHGPKLYLSFAF